MDLRHEIPARAFINAQIIQEAQNNGALSEAINQVPAMPNYQVSGLKEYQFQNPAYVVSLLYCLIVVPKEVWGNDSEDPLYEQIRNQNFIDKFEVLISNENWNNDPHFWLIHYLRNSIAHANYSINNAMEFTFWNRSRTDVVNWKIRVDSIELMRFLSIIGSLLANVGLERG